MTTYSFNYVLAYGRNHFSDFYFIFLTLVETLIRKSRRSFLSFFLFSISISFSFFETINLKRKNIDLNIYLLYIYILKKIYTIRHRNARISIAWLFKAVFALLRKNYRSSNCKFPKDWHIVRRYLLFVLYCYP